MALPASGGSGQGLDSMVNGSELSINVVNVNKPKMLFSIKLCGLSQKACSRDRRVEPPLSWATRLPADREGLTCPVIHTEHGKPVSLPERGNLVR